MHQLAVDEAKSLLENFDRYAIDPTDEQREARDKLEWAINNATRLQAMFFGRVDVGSVNGVKTCHMTLAARWHKPETVNPTYH